MKQLLLIAFLAMTSLSTYGQNTFDNNTGCDLRIRTICIDPDCNVTSFGSWISLPANTTGTSIPGVTSAGCTSPDVQGYEIDYEPTTECSSPVRYTTDGGMACAHSLFGPPGTEKYLDECPCNDGPIRILYWYDPGSGDNTFDARNP